MTHGFILPPMAEPPYGFNWDLENLTTGEREPILASRARKPQPVMRVVHQIVEQVREPHRLYLMPGSIPFAEVDWVDNMLRTTILYKGD